MPVYSSRCRPGLFHPGSTPGVQPFRGLSLARSCATLSVRAVPSWRFFRTATGCHGLDRPSAPLSCAASIRSEAFYRLQGFLAPREFVRVGVRLYALPTADPLLGFCLLTVFPSFVGETDFAASPFSRFHASGSGSFPPVPNTSAPQRFTPQTRWHCLSRDRRTVSRFHACVQLAP